MFINKQILSHLYKLFVRLNEGRPSFLSLQILSQLPGMIRSFKTGSPNTQTWGSLCFRAGAGRRVSQYVWNSRLYTESTGGLALSFTLEGESHKSLGSVHFICAIVGSVSKIVWPSHICLIPLIAPHKPISEIYHAL